MWIESFNLVLDANNDGTITLAEAWHIFTWLYQLPGNLVIELLGAVPPVSRLLHISASAETGYSSLGGGLATALSLLIWLLIIIELASLRERLKTRQLHKDSRKVPNHFRHPAGKA